MMFVGIDGGGTTTRIFFQRQGLDPEYFEFPISLKIRNGDFASSARRVRNILETFAKDRAWEPATIRMSIGLSGMSRPEDQESFRDAIRSVVQHSELSVQIESDATLTLKTVLQEGEEGILLIAGTGSVVFYQPSGNPARRIGGWGPLLSDEGSGYRIGLRSLQHYINVLDGVFPHDAFYDAMEVRLGAIDRTPRAIASRSAIDPAFVASFAKDAFDTADRLKHVQDLIHDELIDLVTLMFPLFFPGIMSGNRPYPLYLSGGVARHPRMLHVIDQAFDEEDLDIHIVDERAPAYKALEIARGM